MEADPPFKVVEGGMVVASFPDGVPDEPFDEQVETNLDFRLAGRPAKEIANEQYQDEPGDGMGQQCAGVLLGW